MAHPGEGGYAICLQVVMEPLVLPVPKAACAPVCLQVTACTHMKGEMAASAPRVDSCGLLLIEPQPEAKESKTLRPGKTGRQV